MKILGTLGGALLLFAATGSPLLAQEEEPEFIFQSEDEEAQEKVADEMAAAFAMFSGLFEAEPLTAEQEALLPLGQQIADAMLPAGTLGQLLEDSIRPMMNNIMTMALGDDTTALALITGVDAQDIAGLEDGAAVELMGIFDPYLEERNSRIGDVTIETMGAMFQAMEPAYRDALARTFTTRFDGGEMQELIAFFDTPLGAKFARTSFSAHYDPQMMGVMEQMGPAMGAAFPAMMEKMIAIAEEIPQPRKFSDLSQAERDRAAALFGKPTSELDALEPSEADMDLDSEDASVI